MPAVREQLHKQVADKYLGDFTRMPNGEYVLHLLDVEGKPVNAVIQLAITGRNEFVKATKKNKPVTEVIEVPNLFE